MEVMFNEAKRVLNTGGLMIITEVLPSTLRESLWYCQLNASLCERVCKLFPSIKQYLSMFDKYKFQCVTKLNILGSELLTLYKDPSGPLDEEWRKSDSMYGMATEQEISDIEEYVKQMIEDKTISQYIKIHDRTLEIGFLTLLVCRSL